MSKEEMPPASVPPQFIRPALLQEWAGRAVRCLTASGDALTVSGKTVTDNVRGAVARRSVTTDPRIIARREEPWAQGGGLAVLWGNLVPNSAVTRPAAIDPDIHTFTGVARCFDQEEAAIHAVLDGRVQEAEVFVIRYEGPKGGPGMREMYSAMKLLYGRLAESADKGAIIRHPFR